MFWMLCSFVWMIRRRVNFLCRRFGTLCSNFIGCVNKKNNSSQLFLFKRPIKKEKTECSKMSAQKLHRIFQQILKTRLNRNFGFEKEVISGEKRMYGRPNIDKSWCKSDVPTYIYLLINYYFISHLHNGSTKTLLEHTSLCTYISSRILIYAQLLCAQSMANTNTMHKTQQK